MYQWTKFWSIRRISDFGTKLAQKIRKTKVLKKVNVKIHKWCQVYCTKVGCRMRLCQEIKWFWRTLSFLNIIVIRWNFGARNEILSFTFLLFLWGNASQKLRISSRFAKCEPLIRTLISCKPEACNFITKVLWQRFFLWILRNF